MAQPDQRKPARQLQSTDLPDPLGDSRDVPMASADDLLSEIVGDDVERLMSGEFEPIAPGQKAVERLQHQIGRFLDEVRQREQVASHLPLPARAGTPAGAPAAVPQPPGSAPSSPPRPAQPAPPVWADEAGAVLEWRDSASSPRPAQPAPSSPPGWEEDAGSALDDLVGPTQEQLIGLNSGEFEATEARGPAESRALLAPVDEAADEPPYLKPLDWISGPVAAMSGRARVAVSLLAVMSFLGGCAALGYVLMLRHGGV